MVSGGDGSLGLTGYETGWIEMVGEGTLGGGGFESDSSGCEEEEDAEEEEQRDLRDPRKREEWKCE